MHVLIVVGFHAKNAIEGHFITNDLLTQQTHLAIFDLFCIGYVWFWDHIIAVCVLCIPLKIVHYDDIIAGFLTLYHRIASQY